MLLRRDAGGLRGRFAEMQEFSQRITKRGQRFILCLAEWLVPSHGGAFNTGPALAANIYLTISYHDIISIPDK